MCRLLLMEPVCAVTTPVEEGGDAAGRCWVHLQGEISCRDLHRRAFEYAPSRPRISVPQRQLAGLPADRDQPASRRNSRRSEAQRSVIGRTLRAVLISDEGKCLSDAESD